MTRRGQANHKSHAQVIAENELNAEDGFTRRKKSQNTQTRRLIE